MTTPEKQWQGFLARYDAPIAKRARAARKTLRRLLPGAFELVYDNYNALVMAFGPSERASEIICSIALYPRWVTLFFLKGAALADPEKLLVGGGKTIRSVVLAEDDTLDRRAVQALVRAAARGAKLGGGALVIKSISPKQRPRRPG